MWREGSTGSRQVLPSTEVEHDAVRAPLNLTGVRENRANASRCVRQAKGWVIPLPSIFSQATACAVFGSMRASRVIHVCRLARVVVHGRRDSGTERAPSRWQWQAHLRARHSLRMRAIHRRLRCERGRALDVLDCRCTAIAAGAINGALWPCPALGHRARMQTASRPAELLQASGLAGERKVSRYFGGAR